MKKYFVIAAGLLLAGCNFGWSESYWVHNTSDEKVTVNDTEVEPGKCVKVNNSFTIDGTEYNEEGHYQWDGSEAKKVSAEDVAVCKETTDDDSTDTDDGEGEKKSDGETETPADAEAAAKAAEEAANAAAEAAEAAAAEAERVANYIKDVKRADAARTANCTQEATVLLNTVNAFVNQVLGEAQKAESATNKIHGIQQKHDTDAVKAALAKAKAAYERAITAGNDAITWEEHVKQFMKRTVDNQCEEG